MSALLTPAPRTARRWQRGHIRGWKFHGTLSELPLRTAQEGSCSLCSVLEGGVGAGPYAAQGLCCVVLPVLYFVLRSSSNIAPLGLLQWPNYQFEIFSRASQPSHGMTHNFSVAVFSFLPSLANDFSLPEVRGG